jgi:hypothetical protein
MQFLHVSPQVKEWYLEKFNLLSEPCPEPRHMVSLRVTGAHHLVDKFHHRQAAPVYRSCRRLADLSIYKINLTIKTID